MTFKILNKMSKSKGKRASYEAGFKLTVLAYAELHGNSNAMRRFGVNEKLVRDWRKKRETLSDMPKTQRARRGNVSLFPELELELKDWVLSQHQNGYIPTRGAIRLQAANLKKTDKYKNLPGMASFVISSGWCTRFMDRHSLMVRPRSKKASTLKDNTKIHTDGKPYSHELSQKAFAQDPLLNKCLMTDDYSEPCNMESTLKTSTGIQAARIPYRHQLCQKTFTQDPLLNKCPTTDDCTEPCKMASTQKAATGIHAARIPYGHQLCQKAFAQDPLLKKHKKTDYYTEPCKCNFCLKSFAELSDLKRHMKIHTGVNRVTYSCRFCKQPFISVSSLVRHASMHASEKPLLKKCTKTDNHTEPCKMASTLKAHSEVHTGRKPYSYKLCQKTFAQDPLLKKRKKTDYYKEPCKMASTVKAHTEVHTDRKPYNYKLCQKTFAQDPLLKKHKKTDYCTKPFKCDFCLKSFAKLSHLRVHMRIHTGANRVTYSCRFCKQPFANVSSLMRHASIHASEKPYICEVCNKRFVRISALKGHRRIHATETCNMCNEPCARISSSVKQCQRKAGKYLQEIKVDSDEIANLSELIGAFSSICDADKENELFSNGVYPDCGGIAGPSRRFRERECLFTSISKFISPIDENVSISRSFGCGICDKILEVEQDFIEHCSSHRFCPPDDIIFTLLI